MPHDPFEYLESVRSADIEKSVAPLKFVRELEREKVGLAERYLWEKWNELYTAPRSLKDV